MCACVYVYGVFASVLMSVVHVCIRECAGVAAAPRLQACGPWLASAAAPPPPRATFSLGLGVCVAVAVDKAMRAAETMLERNRLVLMYSHCVFGSLVSSVPPHPSILFSSYPSLSPDYLT